MKALDHWTVPASRVSWLLSGLLFLLLPKCPFCLAGWLLIVGGVTVSASLAWWLYGSVIGIGLLAWLTIGWLLLRRRGPQTAMLKSVTPEPSFPNQSKEPSHECCCSPPDRQS